MKVGSERHWSSDFVEHLRTVHFSLVVVAVGLIIVVSTQRDTATSRASVQLDIVATLVDQADANWFINHCQELKKKLVASHAGEKDFLLDRGQLYISPQGETAPTIGQIPDQCIIVESDPKKKPNVTVPFESSPHDFAFTKITGDIQRKQKPQTVAEFQQLWDALNSNPQIVVPMSLDKLLLSRSPMNAPRGYEAFKEMGDGASMMMTFDVATAFDTDTPRTFVYRYSGYYVPVATFDFAQFDGISYFRSILPPSLRNSLRSGLFSESFPELNELTKDRQAASFDVWKRAIKAELDRGGETFEAFGLRVPSEVATVWGGVIMLGVQIYFLSHLLELKRKLRPEDPGWDVAWVGIYGGWLAKAMTFMSTALLPVGAVSLLAYKAALVSPRPQIVVEGIVGTALSACLSMASAVRLPEPFIVVRGEWRRTKVRRETNTGTPSHRA